MTTHGSISRLLTVALMVAFQASAVMTLGFSNEPLDPQHCCPRPGIIIGVEIKT